MQAAHRTKGDQQDYQRNPPDAVYRYVITPNGKLGICCCDNFEVTDFGNLNNIALKDAWNSALYKRLRTAVKDGRQNWEFCKHCDFIDTKLRTDIAKEAMKEAGYGKYAK